MKDHSQLRSGNSDSGIPSLDGLRTLLRDAEQRTACSLISVDQVWECDLQLLREGENSGFGHPIALTTEWRCGDARETPRNHKKET